MDKIVMIKDKILDFMEQEVGKYGNNRMDVKEIGELADVIKDLAEAEYYCSVSKAMNTDEQYGYTQPTGNRMGYGGQGGGNASMGGRSGYGGMMGHSDPMSAIRDILMTADPETKSMLRGEISKMLM